MRSVIAFILGGAAVLILSPLDVPFFAVLIIAGLLGAIVGLA